MILKVGAGALVDGVAVLVVFDAGMVKVLVASFDGAGDGAVG